MNFAPNMIFFAPKVIMPRKTISFAEKQDQWLKYVVAQGHYKDESYYVRDLVRKDQAKNAEFYATMAAIEEGYQSGVGERNLDDLWKQAQQEIDEVADNG